MSVVAARWDQRYVEIACDGQGAQGAVKLCSPGKLLLMGGAVVGFTGDRLWQRAIREHDLCPPIDPVDLAAGRAASETWAEGLADRWMAWAKERGHGESQDGTWSVPGWLLVATPAGLWQVTGSGAVVEVQEDYAAAGYGQEVALGALHAGASALGAVVAASDHALYCGPPFTLWRWQRWDDGGLRWARVIEPPPRTLDYGP